LVLARIDIVIVAIVAIATVAIVNTIVCSVGTCGGGGSRNARETWEKARCVEAVHPHVTD
jgi:hypothetical protein